jgi:hypothetical protein
VPNHPRQTTTEHLAIAGLRSRHFWLRASLSHPTLVGPVATISDYVYRTDGVAEGEHPGSVLPVVLLFRKRWQGCSQIPITRQILQAGVGALQGLRSAQGRSVTPEPVVGEQGGSNQDDTDQADLPHSLSHALHSIAMCQDC